MAEDKPDSKSEKDVNFANVMLITANVGSIFEDVSILNLRQSNIHVLQSLGPRCSKS